MLCNATFSPSNSTKAQPTPIIIKQCQNFACICVMMFLSVIFGSVYIFLHTFDWEDNYWLFLFTIAIISIELYFSLFEQDSLFWDSPSPTHHKIENWKCQYTFLGTLAYPDVYHQSVVPVSSLQSSHHPVPGLGEGLCSDGFCLDEEVMVATLYGLEGLVVTAWHLVKFLLTILISVTSYRNVWSKPCQ